MDSIPKKRDKEAEPELDPTKAKFVFDLKIEGAGPDDPAFFFSLTPIG